MAHAERVDDEVVVRTDWTEKDLISQVPGMHYRGTTKRWHGPLAWATCVTLRGVFGERLEVGPKLVEWAKTERTRWMDQALLMRDKIDGVDDDDDSPEARVIRSWR